MWKCIALCLLAVAPVRAQQEQGTAYEALRVIATQMNRDLLNRVISMTGQGGAPQPATWKVLVEDRRARSAVRELEVTDGRISSERTPGRTVVGSTEGATIKTSHLNLDSSGAYAVASHTAEKSHTEFETASYTLRTDERGEPVWIVTLHSRSNQPVGTIYIGANRGTVTRTEGMFSGATMQDVATDSGVENTSHSGGGIVGTTTARIRDTYRRAQDEARGMFNRWRRSFADFISPD
jgi:phage-related tail fiber protein